jgi:hypothetical protein
VRSESVTVALRRVWFKFTGKLRHPHWVMTVTSSESLQVRVRVSLAVSAKSDSPPGVPSSQARQSLPVSHRGTGRLELKLPSRPGRNRDTRAVTGMPVRTQVDSDF